MQENLSQSLLRGEKIELVKERSDSLMKTSGNYLVTSRAVKREMQCRKYKMIALAVLALVVSLSTTVLACVDRYSDYTVRCLRNYIQQVSLMCIYLNIKQTYI